MVHCKLEGTDEMLLTKECDYGIRIIRALSDGKKRTVEAICQAEQIPLQYSYKILKKLERAGFLQSYRGRDGGYRLVKPTGDFSLYDVIIAVEKNLFVTGCLQEGQICLLNAADAPCAVHKEFMSVQEVLIDALRAKTFENVMKTHS